MRGRLGRSGRGVDAALATLATLSAAWPISTLLAQPTWLGGAILLLAVIALSGIGARSLALRSWQVLVAQLLGAVLAAGAIYGRGHLWHGLPTFDTLRWAGTLIRESVATAQNYAAPAPTTPGLMFVVGCSLGLVALAVDYLAVTRRSPSLAGLPLLTVFLATVANRASTLPVVYFLAAATMWLILVARAGNTLLSRWGTNAMMARTPVSQNLDSRGAKEYVSMARALGAAALVAAVAVPVVLPHSPATFLASGLGRQSPQPHGLASTVGFAQSIDLRTDLKSRSRAPVLQYTTADTSPPPLRVAVGSAYRPEAGVWLPWGRPWQSSSAGLGLSTRSTVPEPVGLSPDIPKRTFAMSVRRNLLEDPFLAAPYPMVAADLAGIRWGADDQTQSVRVAERPDSYTISYLHLEPTKAMLRRVPAAREVDQSVFDLDMRLDGPYVERITTLSGQLTSGKDSVYDRAMAIQEYLRNDGGFTYSLTLAPPVKDQSGSSAGNDALTSFLDTKRGYCVQFATAMVMMSRAVGIPARMAIGFLPGTRAKGVWTVLAADAHAWPELYLEGLGWTRFEPTPSRGAAPSYATPAKTSGTAVETGPSDTATARAPLTGQRKDPDAGSPGASRRAVVGLSPTSALQWLTDGWRPVFIVALTALLGCLVVPTAALWRRRRSRATSRPGAPRVEVEWELLTSSLGDLGIPPAPSHTPRQVRAYYDREASLEGTSSQALGRVVQTLERSRYAVSPPPIDELSADARQVLRAAAASRAGRYRLRAALWPSSGVTQLRSARASLAWRLRAPLRGSSDLVRRLSPRRQER
jgi:transglutaminase-like putative cysteine protease